MNLNQLQVQSKYAPLVSVQWLWQQAQQLAIQASQSLAQFVTIPHDPQVVIECDLNSQATFRIYDPYDGKHYTFTSEEDARAWLERGRFN